MSPSNHTYDVLWGVPDRAGLQCGSPEHLVPPCQNSTYNHGQRWSMTGEGAGLKTAAKPTSTRVFNASKGGWVAEIAFPIPGYDSGDAHGGLLDTGGFNSLDPHWPQTALSRSHPLYWGINFARAQHARKYSRGSSDIWSPPRSPAEAAGGIPRNLTTANSTECSMLDQTSPTFLSKYFGSPWGCYWEFAWQGQLYPYMHRPFDWGVLEFADVDAKPQRPCYNLNFPARHIAVQLFYAQQAWATKHNGSYTADASLLASAEYCTYMNETAFYTRSLGADQSTCLLSDLLIALGPQSNITINAYTQPMSKYSKECAKSDCFTAHVSLDLGGASDMISHASIDQNMRVSFPTTTSGRRRCLNDL